MKVQRTDQLAKMRTLYELRERRAHAKVLEQQKKVRILELKFKEIDACVDEFITRLRVLDDRRIKCQFITVSMLQEEAATRLMVERDLRKERLYLQTAKKDVSEALDVLTVLRKQWRHCSARLEALTRIEQNQYAVDARTALQRLEREHDDLAFIAHGEVYQHG